MCFGWDVSKRNVYSSATLTIRTHSYALLAKSYNQFADKRKLPCYIIVNILNMLFKSNIQCCVSFTVFRQHLQTIGLLRPTTKLLLNAP